MGRLERKLAALLLAALTASLLAALGVGWLALRDAYSVGVNARIDAELRSGLAAHRGRIQALRELVERSADVVALDPQLRRAVSRGAAGTIRARLERLLEAHPRLEGLSVRAGQLEEVVRRQDAGDGRPATGALLELRRSLGEGGAELTVTARLPVHLLTAYQQAGEVQGDYALLLRSGRFVTRAYLLVYLGVLGAILAMVLTVSLAAGRRVARRVRDLSEAARRVGRGDLSVRLPPRGTDEIAELTEAFNRMVEDLRESRRRVEYLQRIGGWQQFARRLAHEIKNPLTPIQLAVQELQHAWAKEDAAQFEPVLREASHIIEEEVETLRRLVGEFSAFARLPRARLEAADLRALLEELPRAASAAAHEAGLPAEALRVELQLGEAPLVTRFDAVMLRRALANLVRNAVEAVAERGGGTVRIDARELGRDILIEVADDGPGIPPEARERIFEPYFTSKDHRGGTGLGLAIVKKVVLEHGGEVDVGEAPEGGALFRVRLPALGRATEPPVEERSEEDDHGH